MNKMPEIIIIAAISDNNVIGHENKKNIPWRISSDLKRFKKLTLKHPIIMGYKTFESIGRPLPDRLNIVLTRRNMTNKDNLIDQGIEIATSIENALDIARKTGSEKIFIIGGGEIYSQTIDLAHSLYITHIQAEIYGNVFFPSIDPDIWEKKSDDILVPVGKGDHVPTRFSIYSRSREKPIPPTR